MKLPLLYNKIADKATQKYNKLIVYSAHKKGRHDHALPWNKSDTAMAGDGYAENLVCPHE